MPLAPRLSISEQLSRRRLITSGAAAGAAAIAVPAVAGAAPVSTSAEGFASPIGRANATVPIPAVGQLVHQHRLGPYDFRSIMEEQILDYTDFGARGQLVQGGQPAHVAIGRFPLGAVVTKATVFAHVLDSLGGVDVQIGQSDGIDPPVFPTVHQIRESDPPASQFGAPAPLRQKEIPLGFTILDGSLVIVRAANVINTLNNIQAVVFEYRAPPTFNPVAPGRVIDTRNPGTPGSGTLTAAATRKVFVGDTRNASGAVDVMDVIPPQAVAVAVNVTVTDTTGPGFVTVAPGSTTASSSSTINWSGAGQTVANSTIVAMDGDQRLNLLCGPSPCSVILDVNGYWV